MWIDTDWMWTLANMISRADNAYWKCRCSMTSKMVLGIDLALQPGHSRDRTIQ